MECPSCGLLFRKWMRQRFRAPARENSQGRGRLVESLWARAQGRLFYVEPRVNVSAFWGQAALYLAFFAWGWQFILMDYETLHGGLPEINGSFMHRVNLVFHEAGHVLFIPLGRFMAVLGGSLGQLLMPAIVIGAFLFKTRDTFGASIGLWWLGQSCMDLAPYINDARAGQLILLGGVTGRDRPGYHDWENILGTLGWMHYDHAIAGFVHGAGIGLMLLSFVWGAYVLYLRHRNLDPRF